MIRIYSANSFTKMCSEVQSNNWRNYVTFSQS